MKPETQNIKVGMHVRILNNQHGRCWEVGYVKSIQNNMVAVSGRHGNTMERIEDLESTGQTELEAVKAASHRKINGHDYVCIYRFPKSKVEAKVWAHELRGKPYVNSVRVVKVKDGWCVYSAFLE